MTRPAALFGPCLRPRVAQGSSPVLQPRESRSRALHQYQRRSARTRVRGCAAGRLGARRRPLRAQELAAARAPTAIAGLAGRPYAELATGVMEPFVGGALPRAELLAMARDSYARFGHPAVTPLVQIDANLWVLELFHGPTLAFKDVAMQLLARLMDRVLGAARRAGHHRRRHLRRHRRRGHRGLPRLQAHRRHHPVPARPRLRRAAAHDDHRARAQRARRRHRRHVRRLPGAGEGHVQRPGLSRPHQAGRRQLDQLGARGGADRLLLRRRHGARRPAPAGLVHGADRQLRRHPRRLRRAAHGPADRAADHRHQRQRHPGAHACHRRLRGARRQGHHLAVDGHPGLLQLRALPVRGLRPRRRLGAGEDGRARPVGPLRARASARADAARLRRRQRQRGRGGRLHPPRQPAQRLPARPAHRLRRRRGREGRHRRGAAHRARHRPPGQVPRRPAGDHRRAPRLAAAPRLADERP